MVVNTSNLRDVMFLCLPLMQHRFIPAWIVQTDVGYDRRLRHGGEAKATENFVNKSEAKSASLRILICGLWWQVKLTGKMPIPL